MASAFPGVHATAALLDGEQDTQSIVVRSPLRRGNAIVGDLLGAVALVLCVPFVLLAIGSPIVLFVRLLLWLGGLL